MITIDEVLFFDTETTGIPDRAAKWDVDFESYPHVVQLAWKLGDKEESHIIRPDGWAVPDEAAAVHGITTERAQQEGEPFVTVIDRFLAFCRRAVLLCGHNIHFDTSILKANILRELGHEYFDAEDVDGALYKGKRIDTMRPTMKWVDARTQDGRLKFPRLEELFSRCYPGETFPAHDALADTRAVARCLPRLLEEGLVELKLKEYPDEQQPASGKTAQESEKQAETPKRGPNPGLKDENGKLYGESLKTPSTEFFGKITEKIDGLMAQNDF